MIDPRQSHVFAVGISSYNLGSSWHLPKAAEHALAFAAWARKRGVPRGNIHLFLSTVDRARLAADIAQADVEANVATFAAVTDFAFRDLTGMTGELLYMFWAGHGSISEDGFRVLFFEDLTPQAQLPFDLNDFYARLRTSSFKRFNTQIGFVDACANRFEELGFDASLGQIRPGKGRHSHAGMRQTFFLAADSGEQAREGAFGAAVIKALIEQTARDAVWPPDQDAIVRNVRPQFEGASQHPVQLVWTTADGDLCGIEHVSGELPASRLVNAAAFSRELPVRALRRLTDIALQYAQLAEMSATGAKQRDNLYASLCWDTGHAGVALARSTARIEMLLVVAAALQWNSESSLVRELGRLAPAAEFEVELDRLALIQQVRSLVRELPATTADLRDEYLKTMSRLSRESARMDATTIDAMLDELYQISAAVEPQRSLWEFLLRLADRFPTHRVSINDFLSAQIAIPVTLNTLRSELQREILFVLSINLSPGDTDEPTIESIDARLVIGGTSNVLRTFGPLHVTSWEGMEAQAAEIVREARRIVMDQYRRDEAALLVEFLMPAMFLSRSPDRLMVKLGAASRPLGRLHSVVVRLRDRIVQPSDTVNLDEWEAIASRIDRDGTSIVHWMDPTRATPTIETCQGLVVLQFLPRDDLVEIVNDGFPFIAWLRAEPDSADWAAFAQRFEAWAGAQPLKSLARDVRSIRRRPADVGTNLTLFWDDPNQIRHWSQLSDVSIGGAQ